MGIFAKLSGLPGVELSFDGEHRFANLSVAVEGTNGSTVGSARVVEGVSDAEEITVDGTQIVEGTSAERSSSGSESPILIGSDSKAARMTLGRKRTIIILPMEISPCNKWHSSFKNPSSANYLAFKLHK